ncbi:MAG: DUF6364 family protein [Flavobacteriales bacterium]
MKKKLTLSLRPSRIAMLRKASAKRSTSISELVEEFAERIDEQPSEAIPGILKWKGYWAKFITEKDFEADDRAGAELRKTEAYQRLKAKRRKKE